MAATTSDAPARVHALDGLRGLAALAVVAFHVLDYLRLPRWVLSNGLTSPLGVLVNGLGRVAGRAGRTKKGPFRSE